MKGRWAAAPTVALLLAVTARAAAAGELAAAAVPTAEPPPDAPATPPPPAPPPPSPPLVLLEPSALPPPRAPGGAAAPLAGVATAIVPFVVGCAFWARDDRRDLQRAGTVIMTSGFAAAPWVSHGVQRRWRRAAVFGGISLATSAATVVAMGIQDPFDQDIPNRKRVAFGFILTSAMLAAAIGVYDSFLVANTPEPKP